jgi:hypothetical protein
MGVRSLLGPRSMLNPVSRLAVATFAWKHRHEILRWGRSLYEQLMRRHDLSPVRAARVASVLFAVASDASLRDAPELRRVALVGDTVDLEVDERWPQLPRLVERVRRIKGVREVHVNGASASSGRGRLRAAAS